MLAAKGPVGVTTEVILREHVKHILCQVPIRLHSISLCNFISIVVESIPVESPSVYNQ